MISQVFLLSVLIGVQREETTRGVIRRKVKGRRKCILEIKVKAFIKNNKDIYKTLKDVE